MRDEAWPWCARTARPNKLDRATRYGMHQNHQVESKTSIGGGGIRTNETLSSLTVFKTVAFVHSATPPERWAAVGPGVDCSDRLHADRAGHSPGAPTAIRDNLPPKLLSTGVLPPLEVGELMIMGGLHHHMIGQLPSQSMASTNRSSSPPGPKDLGHPPSAQAAITYDFNNTGVGFSGDLPNGPPTRAPVAKSKKRA